MDVGYYISDLLGQHGDVNVPGLGYFAHTRVNGYYNDTEGKFYPPGYSVQFDSQFLDHDDSLAEYIAEKKKISLASSKYFTEKFVSGLKQQAMSGEVALADMGWFSTSLNARLLFRANTVTSTDPEFFGYTTVPLRRIGYQPAAAPADAVPRPDHEDSTVYTNPPAVAQQGTVYSDQFKTEQEHEDYLVELTAAKRKKTTWLFIVMAVIFTAAGVWLVQRYDPSAFTFFNKPKEKPAEAPKIILTTDDSAAAKKDTADAPLVRNADADSLNVKTVPLADPSLRPRFELIDGSYKTLNEASLAIVKFKTKGVEAKMVRDPGTGPLYKVSIGTYATRGEAEDALKDKLAAQIATPGAQILEINPQTTGIAP